ncbi:MAG: neutral zinc metallopeptidase [Sphingomicrobium sp.]
MRLGDDGSGNFEDRTGQSGFGGGGGNLLGCLLPFVLSRFGIVGVLVLLLGYCALTSLGGGGGILGGGSTTSSPSASGASTLSADDKRTLTSVLLSTEKVWGDIFAKNGKQYTPTTLVAYSNANQSGCGAAQAAMGPFYCPTDKDIYIDPAFFTELRSRFNAPGDFPQAYVIAHEVGHHIQDLEGRLDEAATSQARAGRADGNAIQVGIELQADCYAGVWAANAKAPDGTAALEPGDVEEGMKAAEAIGDDTLQQQAQGRVSPESFTHGSAAQRMAALRTGLQSGNPAACNFNAR